MRLFCHMLLATSHLSGAFVIRDVQRFFSAYDVDPAPLTLLMAGLCMMATLKTVEDYLSG